MVGDRIRTIPDFPKGLASELKHCILAHHGELEFGSPKKPALPEALALSFADNIDAKMETVREIFNNVPENNQEWQGTTVCLRAISDAPGNYNYAEK